MGYMKRKHFDRLVKYLDPKASKKTMKATRLALTEGYSIRGAAAFIETDNAGVTRQAARIRELYELCEAIAKDLK